MRIILCAATIALGFLLLPSVMQAQKSGRISASSVCGRSEVHQTVVIEDQKQHSISLDQRPCTWGKPIEIAGTPGHTYMSYGVDDVQNNASHDQGYAVGALTNGDKYFLRYDGTSRMSGGVPVHLEGTWEFTGGTGSLQRLKGSGTYQAQPSAAGEMVFKIEGEYQISESPPK
jgi:hypothetical protein